MMTNDMKARINNAIMKHSAAQLPKASRKSKKRESPEKKFEKELLPWLRDNGFDVSVVDSSTYGVWESKKTSESMPDIVGDLCVGGSCKAAYIEIKADGSRSRASVSQYLFLKRKIERGAFGCVTDSIEHISSLLKKWVTNNGDPQVLLSDLPMNAEIRRHLEDIDRPLNFD